MDVPRALEQRAAFAVGIVDGFDRAFGPVDRPLGEIEGQAVVPGMESVEGVERFVDAPCPTAGLAILNVAASGRRLVDRLAQTRCESLVVGAIGGRGDFSLRNRAGSRSASSTIIATRDAFGLPARWARMRASAPALSGWRP
jgi:hypothetical protein